MISYNNYVLTVSGNWLNIPSNNVEQEVESITDDTDNEETSEDNQTNESK